MTVSQISARRITTAFGLAVALMLGVLGSALAHEHREVGDYELTVGWRVEPALVEQPNGLDLRVASIGGAHAEEEAGGDHAEEPEHSDESAAVTGLEETLFAEVTFGDRTMPLELRAAFGEPGSYTSDLIPTVPGSYIFRIYGTIEGVEIDETFNSADGQFSDIEPLSAIQFPEPVESAGSMQAQLLTAQEAANSARTFGMVGLAAGILGLAASAIALLRR